MPQERSHNHDVEHTVDVPAPQIIEEIAEGTVSVPQQRLVSAVRVDIRNSTGYVHEANVEAKMEGDVSCD